MAIVALTKSFVESIQCPLNRNKIDFYDECTRGLLIEVRISGGKTYYLRYTDFRGKFRQLRLGNVLDITLSDARSLADQMRRKIALGIDPHTERVDLRNSVLFSEFINQKYLPHIQLYKRSWKTDFSMLKNHVLPKFGRLHMDEITRELVVDLHRGLKAKGAADATCNRLLVLVKFIFNLALKWKTAGLKENPAKDVPFLSMNNQKDRYLTNDETRRLHEALSQSENPMLKHIILLLVLTGARKSEVLGATWQEFDFERRTWRISMSKSGKARYVPLGDSVVSLLRGIPRFSGCQYVFPNPETCRPYRNIFRTWNRARTDAGIKDVRIHDLRHNFASLLINNGRSLYEVQQILGHAQIRTTQRYAHLANETLIAAANVAGGAVQSYTKEEKVCLANVEEKPLSNQMTENGLDSAEKPTLSDPWVMVA